MKTCREKAEEWGVSERSVTNMCSKGMIPGAHKTAKSWEIPDDAIKPADRRKTLCMNTDSPSVSAYRTKKKPLPIGISDYVRAQSDYYYVDKTLMIRDFLDRIPFVSLFTRPRRFGKTLNMDMLRVFFEKVDEDTSVYFRNKKIWAAGRNYTKHQGKYPVIFLTFKDAKADSLSDTMKKIRSLLQVEFARHEELQSSEKLNEHDLDLYQSILDGTADNLAFESSLESLSRMLNMHHGKAPIIIIDEYDTPIQEGYSKGFYDDIVPFMRNFFSGAFKDNRNLSYGFMTGILRIAQESLFSGLNNLSVYSVMDTEYAQYFGFTQKEIDELLAYYEMTGNTQELQEWYDGYLFGNTEIYNPWSVINYVSRNGSPQTYWANTGRNEILEDILKYADNDTAERLQDLLLGKRQIAAVDLNVVYRSLTEDSSKIYSLLAVAGYLKITPKAIQGSSYICEVQIPNKEIASVYKAEVLSHMVNTGAVKRSTANHISESLYLNNPVQLQNALKQYMDETISFYDAGTEGFYHGMVLGLIALMDSHYLIKSNRESGEGRYDISLIPRSTCTHGIIMELKWKKSLSDEKLQSLAENALIQIDEKKYGQEMEQSGITDILRLGIAFSGKNVKIAASVK